MLRPMKLEGALKLYIWLYGLAFLLTFFTTGKRIMLQVKTFYATSSFPLLVDLEILRTIKSKYLFQKLSVEKSKPIKINN